MAALLVYCDRKETEILTWLRRKTAVSKLTERGIGDALATKGAKLKNCSETFAGQGPIASRCRNLSITLLEKTPILSALHASGSNDDLLDPGHQLILFDF